MKFANEGPIGVLEVSDVSGQRTATVTDVPADATVEELLDGLLSEMRLNRSDTEGRPLSYHVRLEREGRHLLAAERLGEALMSGDQLVLQPNVDAG